jgi:hypothetical protein
MGHVGQAHWFKPPNHRQEGRAPQICGRSLHVAMVLEGFTHQEEKVTPNTRESFTSQDKGVTILDFMAREVQPCR